jgi:hypothetical protein
MIHRIFIAVALYVATFCAVAQSIPSYLVGVWANDGAVMRGALLFEGQAVYIGLDGVGAVIGGPPPIGAKIIATFDSKKSLLMFDIFEGNRRIGSSQMAYDEKAKTLNSGEPKPLLLKRRFDTFDEATKRALGL